MWSYKTATHLDVQGLFWNPSQTECGISFLVDGYRKSLDSLPSGIMQDER